MTHEHGYDFPETDAEKHCCECERPLDTWCDMCGDPVCESHLALRDEQTLCLNCEEVAERVELDVLWGRMYQRCNNHPSGIVHKAWAHSYNPRSLDDAGYIAAVAIFKRAISDIFTGWTEAA